MALVRLSDAIIPAVWKSYDTVDIISKTAIWDSGVVYTNPTFTDLLGQGGIDMTVPYWGDIDPTIEPNYSTDNPADIAVPNKIGSGYWKARKSFVNQGFSDADLVKELAGSDPMLHIRNRFNVYWKRQWQRRLIATLLGIYNDNVAGGMLTGTAGDMVTDISGLAGANAIMNFDSFIDARSTFGDTMEENKGAVLMHSGMYAFLLKQEQIAFVPDSETKQNIAYYNGYRVILDDAMPRTGTAPNYIYTLMILGPSTIGYAETRPAVPFEIDRKPDQGNGGGVEVIWERRNWMLHPVGYRWEETTVTGQSPTLANLQLAVNWTRVFERKSIPIAFLRAKTVTN